MKLYLVLFTHIFYFVQVECGPHRSVYTILFVFMLKTCLYNMICEHVKGPPTVLSVCYIQKKVFYKDYIALGVHNVWASQPHPTHSTVLTWCFQCHVYPYTYVHIYNAVQFIYSVSQLSFIHLLWSWSIDLHNKSSQQKETTIVIHVYSISTHPRKEFKAGSVQYLHILYGYELKNWFTSLTTMYANNTLCKW